MKTFKVIRPYSCGKSKFAVGDQVEIAETEARPLLLAGLVEEIKPANKSKTREK